MKRRIQVLVILILLPVTVSDLYARRSRSQASKLIKLANQITYLETKLKRSRAKLTEEAVVQAETEIKILKSRLKALKAVNKQHAGAKAGEGHSVSEYVQHETGLEFSGFFDVYTTVPAHESAVFNLGDFELDLEKSLPGSFSVASALVFNQEGAELGAGFIDYHFFGGAVSPRGRLFSEEGLHLQVGRFDVPFGNDWQYFAAPDRITVNAPLTTELIMHGGYNSDGARVLGNFTSLNFSLHALNGNYNFLNYGARVGVTPFNNPYTLGSKQNQKFELGLSFLNDIDREGSSHARVYGLDVESELSRFRFRLENIYRSDATDMYGYHVTLYLNSEGWLPGSIIFFTRYETFSVDDSFRVAELFYDQKQQVNALTAGFNLGIKQASFLKTEFTHFLKEYEDYGGYRMLVQLVIYF